MEFYMYINRKWWGICIGINKVVTAKWRLLPTVTSQRGRFLELGFTVPFPRYGHRPISLCAMRFEKISFQATIDSLFRLTLRHLSLFSQSKFPFFLRKIFISFLSCMKSLTYERWDGNSILTVNSADSEEWTLKSDPSDLVRSWWGPFRCKWN